MTKPNGHVVDTPKQVRDELNSRLHSVANRIRAEFEPGGRIVLHGHVATYYQKQLAQEALLHQPGVAQVINEIVVDPAATN